MERVEPLHKQDMNGKDKIGQDIEIRTPGKQAPENATTIKEDLVLKTSPNFNRARIPLDDTTQKELFGEYVGEKRGERL